MRVRVQRNARFKLRVRVRVRVWRNVKFKPGRMAVTNGCSKCHIAPSLFIDPRLD